jgi:hypothetical protein
MSGTGIKKNNDGVSIQGKHTSEDLLTLGNILHGSVLGMTGVCNSNLLITTWRMVGVALSSALLQSGALPGEVASLTTVEADITRGGGGPSGEWCR